MMMLPWLASCFPWQASADVTARIGPHQYTKVGELHVLVALI